MADYEERVEVNWPVVMVMGGLGLFMLVSVVGSLAFFMLGGAA